jgi:hypothetical protein
MMTPNYPNVAPASTPIRELASDELDLVNGGTPIVLPYGDGYSIVLIPETGKVINCTPTVCTDVHPK